MPRLQPISTALWTLRVTALFVCLSSASSAQPTDPTAHFVHETWTVREGLPVNGITHLIQGTDGYLWMSTYDGLVRFDGVRFTIFSTGNTPGLPSNRIVYIMEAKDGALWMLTEQGHVVRFQGGVFESYGPDEGPGGGATKLYEDEQGTIWVGTEKGVRYFENGKLIAFAADVLDQSVEALLRARDGALWVGLRWNGVRRIKDGNITAFTTNNGLAGNEVTALHEDEHGAIWIGSIQGINRFQHEQLSILSLDGILEPGVPAVTEFFRAPGSSVLWIGTSREILYYEKDELHRIEGSDGSLRFPNSFAADKDGTVCFYMSGRLFRNGEIVHEFPPETPPLFEIRGVLHDHEGSIWIASGTQGLHRLKPSVFHVYSKPEGVAYENIYPILEDRDGVMWLGTWGKGVSRIADGEITTPLDDGLILSLCEDSDGRLWVGSMYGAHTYRITGDSLEKTGHAIVNGPVFAVYQDRSGSMWIGAKRGLYRVQNDSLIQVTGHGGVPASYVRVFHETRNGSLWMGTNGSGLERHRDGRFDKFTEKDGLSSNLIRAVYEDQEGYLWVGTEGRGLCRLDRHGSDDLSTITVTVYRKKDGLFDEVIHQILEDDNGRLWMSTNRGIFWVPREQLNAFADGRATRIVSTSYTERDGMRSREANGGMQPAGIRASDGRLWWPTQDGAVVVDPSRIQHNKVPPPIVIEALTSDETLVDHLGGAAQLQASQRDFEIVYTALSFMAPENVRFKYRLEGFHSDWVQASNRRTAFYTNVPPGEYHFQVIASNNDGVWNETGASLAVTIDPYIYETRWFMILVAALTALLIWAGYRRRTRRLVARERVLKVLVAARTSDLEQEKEATEKERERADEQRIAAEHLRELAEQARATVEAQAEKLKTLDVAKSHFFANVSHEFRTPLTLIIGPLEDLLKGLRGELTPDTREELELSLRNGRLLLRLVNQILDIAKLEAGQMKLRAERVDLAVLLENTALAFSSLAERSRIHFQVETPGEPFWIYGDADMLEKVFTNLLSNAFKFTPGTGSVRLESDTTRAGAASGEIDVIVRDSGAGIPPAKLPHVFERFYQAEESVSSWQPGTGIGLALARELVDLHGGRIDVESEEGFGSTFTVTLKCGRSHLRPEDIAEPPATTRPRPAVSIEAVADDISDARPSESPAAKSDDVTTVLVIDDNPDIRTYIRRRLEPTYRVIEAADGADGLESTRRWLPDIVISDVKMPKMDGHAFCEAVKRDAELNYIPVVLLTAKATTEERIEGLELGADDYLTKPFDVNELLARVSNLVDSRLRLRERFRRHRATVHASEVTVTSSDDTLLEQLRETVEAEMADEEFTVDRFAERIGMSRGHLHRRIRDVLDETPTEFIRRIRLERAIQLLAGRAGSVSEVAYGVGFKSVSHFSKCFREHAGVTPSQYIAQSPTPPR